MKINRPRINVVLIAIAVTIAILLYSTSAEALGDFAMRVEVPNISSVAVGGDGTIFAACNDGAIKVYAPDGTLIRSINPISNVFRYPTSIFYHEGRLYLTDLWYKHVAVIEPDGKPVFTFGGAGEGPRRFVEPSDVFVWEGLIYVADRMGGNVQVFGPNGVYAGTINMPTDRSSGRPMPVSVAVDGKGYVYVVDETDMRVKVFNDRWEYLEHMKKVRGASFVRVLDGVLVVSDQAGGRFTLYDNERNPIGTVGYLGDAKDEFLSIGSIALDSSGKLVAADAEKNDLKVFNLPIRQAGGQLRSKTRGGYAEWVEDLDLAGDVLPAKAVMLPDGAMLMVDFGGKALVEIRGGRVDRAIRLPGWNPVSVSLGPDGGIWVVDAALKRVLKLDLDGNVLSSIGPWSAPQSQGAGNAAMPEALVDPSDVLVMKSSEVLVADAGAGKVNVYSSDGRYLGRLGRGGTSAFITMPVALDADEQGTIYVLDAKKPSIILYSDRGAYIREIGGYGAGLSIMKKPVTMRLLEDEIVVIDGGTDTIRLITKSGDLLMQFGSSGSGKGEFQAPSGIIGLGSGMLAISDTGNSRISYYKYIYPQGYR